MERDERGIADIQRRHDFIGMNAEDLHALRALHAPLAKALPDALDALYAHIRRTPEVSRFFASEAKIDQAKKAQTAHWQAVLAARFDDAYVAKVRSIGEVHARIGLTPQWYIGGYTIILDRLIRSIIEENGGAQVGLFSRSSGRKHLAESVSSLCKAVLTEIDLTVSFYLEAMEADRAKLRAEQERRVRDDHAVLSALNAALTFLADGDLTYRVTEVLPEHSASLKQRFNASAQQLAESMSRIAQSTHDVMANADGIRHGADSLSEATEQQAAAQEEMSAAVTQIALGASETAEETVKARHMAASAQSDAEQASQIVAEAIAAISRIEKSSQEISNIIGVINKISMQTNILSLNASVEAARAGDYGRGFAVVASEVRALAERSTNAGKEIAGLITKAAEDVMSGVTQVHRAGEALQRITSQVSDMNGVISRIATASQAQSAGLDEVKIAIRSLEQTTLKNATIAEESAATAHNLVTMADELAQSVASFKTKAETRSGIDGKTNYQLRLVSTNVHDRRL
ncbi:methyl-accepting chemotaxis protein [Gluconacetobacter sp.]|uniref:methyl-accepting chemotaxis protein n=1 Tax=Gluconacetobacter sp. TaxID=1935994 RepID=UPI0039E8C0B0